MDSRRPIATAEGAKTRDSPIRRDRAPVNGKDFHHMESSVCAGCCARVFWKINTICDLNKVYQLENMSFHFIGEETEAPKLFTS